MAPDITWLLGQFPEEVMDLEGSVPTAVISLWRGSSNILGPGVSGQMAWIKSASLILTEPWPSDNKLRQALVGRGWC